MNKFLTGVLAFTFAIFAICCDDEEQAIAETELPQAARNFIMLHFPRQTIAYSVRDEEEYVVSLGGEFGLEFDEDGTWNEIESKGEPIPTSIIDELPDALSGYLSDNYGTEAVIKLEINRSNYEVGLSNHLELTFDVDGNFIRLDD